MSIAIGVYLDANNYSALVFKADEETVYYVSNEGTKEGFDVRAMGLGAFVRRYKNFMPLYPVRRCARVFNESYSPKTALATRVINHLLRS